MYFVNETHEQNYNYLLNQYPFARTDSEYKSGFYIVAHPDIFSYCNGNPVSHGRGPYDWFFEQRSGPDLSGGFVHLVKAGLNLYNNFQGFSLYLALATWGHELYNVFVQACKIRRSYP
ncbi:hypothetical protein QP794_01120 [Paenibacillus sp. UMB7766-LJ446]|uniref:hypothetical protein n=1 Tax=Paenibacillus sp. UMB7766-LJ446 TaxID=3046313 RepID=UPI0023D8DC96|nr:hypothetical protein [Paenibacillus sp. UMB7766-LJ446]MDK8188681.1 hypothetical protein [Paenibacillus sp. UMB7766-LJ446]